MPSVHHYIYLIVHQAKQADLLPAAQWRNSRASTAQPTISVDPPDPAGW